MGNRIMRTLILLGTLFVVASSARAVSFDWGTEASVTIDLPAGWTADSSVIDSEGSLVFSMWSAQSPKMTCLVSVRHLPPPIENQLLDRKELVRVVEMMREIQRISTPPQDLAVPNGVAVFTSDPDGRGIVMIAPLNGVTITAQFNAADEVEGLKRAVASMRIQTK